MIATKRFLWVWSSSYVPWSKQSLTDEATVKRFVSETQSPPTQDRIPIYSCRPRNFGRYYERRVVYPARITKSISSSWRDKIPCRVGRNARCQGVLEKSDLCHHQVPILKKRDARIRASYDLHSRNTLISRYTLDKLTPLGGPAQKNGPITKVRSFFKHMALVPRFVMEPTWHVPPIVSVDLNDRVTRSA